LGALVLPLVAVAAMGALIWALSIAPALLEGVAKNQQEIARRAADQIDHFIETRVGELTAAAQIGTLRQADKDRRRESLQQVLKLDPEIEEISITDESGRETIRFSRLSAYTDDDLRLLGNEEKFRWASEGKVYISPVYYAPTAEPFVSLAVPIKFASIEIKGVIIGEVSLKKLWSSISGIKVGKSGQIFVVDNRGQLIAHPDYSRVLSGTNLAALHEVEEFLGHLDPDPGFGKPVTGQDGKLVISSFARVERPDWAVVVEEPVETALKEIKQIEMLAIVFFVLVLCGTVGISHYFSSRVTRQVRQLEEGAKVIADGNLEYKLNIHSGDEIESLANQFNRMAVELRGSYQGLEDKIAERTRDLSSLYAALAPLALSDTAQLSQQVADRLKEATHADAALIHIFDKQKKYFLHLAQTGFPSSYLASARRIPERDTAIGIAFWTETPIIAANIAADSRLKSKKQLESGLKSCAFLPFRISGEVRGIIHLASRTEGHFSEDKTDHLMAIARQMGVAMENQELFQQAEQRAEEQATLRTLAMATSQLLEIEKLFDIALEKTLEVTGRPRITIRLADPVTGEVKLVAHRGFASAELKKIKTVHSAVEEVFRSGNVLVIDDTGVRPCPDLLGDTRSVAWIPIKAESKVVGVLGISATQSRAFSPGEVRLLEAIGSIVGVAIGNARLFSETKRQAAELSLANKGKDEFLSILSHELRSPLNVVLGYSQVLKEGILGEVVPEQEKALDRIMTAAKGQLAMVNGILQVTKIEAGAASVTTEEVKLAELLDEIRSGYDLPVDKEPAIRWEFGSELPIIKTDGEKLKHVLQNLINNAIKFTEKGNVVVSARYVPDPMKLEFRVSDTGIGIPQEALPTIFQMFKQADSSDARRHEGLGIGLFIVKKFTEMLGGSIDVKSEPQKGSTFTVTLPAEIVGSKGVGPRSSAFPAGPAAASTDSL
jgi:signal transduction histidine kinase